MKAMKIITQLQEGTCTEQQGQDTAEPMLVDLVHRKKRKASDLLRSDVRMCLEDASACQHAHEGIQQRTSIIRRDTPSSKQTAYDIYQSIPHPKSQHQYGSQDACKNERLWLLSQVTGNQERIKDILHLRRATANTGHHPPSSKRNSLKVTQLQAYVQWADTIVPTWTVELASHLGYHPEATQDATEDQVFQEVPQKCEYCILSTANDDGHPTAAAGDIKCSQEDLEACVCESCYRLFHIECLTPMETTRWKSVVGTSEPYYCMACSKDNKHVELNPQLKWLRVQWQPRYGYVGHLGGYGSSVKCCMMFNVQFSHVF
jgi:hypothetical protein